MSCIQWDASQLGLGAVEKIRCEKKGPPIIGGPFCVACARRLGCRVACAGCHLFVDSAIPLSVQRVSDV